MQETDGEYPKRDARTTPNELDAGILNAEGRLDMIELLFAGLIQALPPEMRSLLQEGLEANASARTDRLPAPYSMEARAASMQDAAKRIAELADADVFRAFITARRSAR